jgi:hypothetical protein
MATRHTDIKKPAGAGTPDGKDATRSYKNIAIPVGDVNEKLSIAFAMQAGYKVLLDGDGEAEITAPTGEAYYIANFECNCPDKLCRGGSHKGHCKHEIWLSQLRPCELCGATMSLTAFRTCFGETGERFECPVCCNAWDIGIVRAERRMNRETSAPSPKLTVKGRCQQAISWLVTGNRDFYIWKLVEQSPHLATPMIRELSATGQGKLADQIAKQYGLKPESAGSPVSYFQTGESA